MTAGSLPRSWRAGLTPWREPAAIALGVLLVAAYYYLPGALGLPALIAFAVFAIFQLPIATALTLAAAPFYLPNESNPLAPKTFGSAQFTLVEALTLALFAGYLLRDVVDWLRTRRPPAWVDWAFSRVDRLALIGALGLLGWGLVSVVLARYEWVALREWRTVILEPLLFYVVARTVADKAGGRLRLVVGFLAGAVFVCLIVIAHYYLTGIVEETGGVGRALGVYHSPNALALYLDRVLPFAVAVVAGWRNRRSLFAFGIVTVLLVAFALGLTYSRAAWLAAALGVLFVLAVRNRRSGLIALAMVCVLGIGAVLFVPPERLLGGATAGRRVLIWESALTLVSQHPLTGIGLDNFLYYYRDEGYLQPDAVLEPDISHPHNWLLDWWLRLGLPGLLVFAILQIGFWRSARAIIARPVGLGLSALMLVTLAHGLVDNHFFVVDLAFVFWFAMALANGAAMSGGAST